MFYHDYIEKYEFPYRKFSDLIGNQSLDSDVCSHHEFPDLIFSKLYGEFVTVNVSRSMRSTRYDSSKDIKTVYPGSVFLWAEISRKAVPGLLFYFEKWEFMKEGTAHKQ